MSDCGICDIAESDKLKLFEDENLIIALAPRPAAPGHLMVFPKKHVTILEQVPDYIASWMLQLANKASMALFEGMNAEGTNILLQNGTAAGQSKPHCTLHIIPRRQGDAINTNWQPKQLDEEEMSTVELKLKEEAKNIGAFEEEPQKPIELEDKAAKIRGDEENYLIKQIERIP
ncbi:hypothetical protein COT48_01445 [Candidatus Woesearchaeota archaeon CG08_land_8_20_14_0_20_47_9]|nr:MAG: hypothetical protein AUJ69_01720 [Candidatus Woesearchaeota archaeon CG1_02_47_18]PIO04237.1 MAG: hypothetical protein COT48_01445 [Candidatus Woesearchaeota archaeon CG08_land_8_20_14_0_20_47_9]HII30038.1 HIT family protein [Candidatus Woesearchaeota archaeon]